MNEISMNPLTLNLFAYLQSRTNLLLLIVYLSLATIFAPLQITQVNNCPSGEHEYKIEQSIVLYIDYYGCSLGRRISNSPVGSIPKSSAGWFLPLPAILQGAILKKRLTKGERRRQRRRAERLYEARSQLFDLMQHSLSQTFVIPSIVTFLLILFCIVTYNIECLFLAFLPLLLWLYSNLEIRYHILRQPEAKFIKWGLQLIALSFILTATGWFLLWLKQFLYLSHQLLFASNSFVLASTVVVGSAKIAEINIASSGEESPSLSASNQEVDYWSKARQITQVASYLKNTNLREIAKASGFSLTSVYRHMKAKIARDQHPESHFWETEEGQKWLARLVCSTLFHFAIKRGIGLESLSDFLKTLQIDTHFGVSATALRGVQSQIEEQVIKYGQIHSQEGAQASTQLEIVGGVDETFFDQMVLVMLDLVSGYALCEEFSESRTTETWKEKVDKALKPFGAKVRYLVSDRAKPLINLATEHFECSSIADLFHAVHKISQGFSLPLQRRLKNAEKEAQKAHEKLKKISEQESKAWQEQQACYQKAQEEVKKCQKIVEQYQSFLHQFTLTVHPFDTTDSSPQSSSAVTIKLGKIVANLLKLGEEQQLVSYQKHLKTVKNQLTDLGALMDVWFEWVDQSLAEQKHDQITQAWLKEIFLPKIYWQCQLKKCRSKKLRPIYQTAYQQSMLKLSQHPLTEKIEPELMREYEEWAKTMVNRFQRTSSAVEGRNGHLSQLNFCRRGLGKKKLPVLTVLHNFELRRQDGTTAAQRFFGIEFPDLFESVLPNINKLPRPRKSRSLKAVVDKAVA